MALYRNRTTGLVQFHPVSGIGDALNSDEIEETGKPIKPRTSLAPSRDEIRTAKNLMKDQTASPLEPAAAETLVEIDKRNRANAQRERGSTKTTRAKSGAGDSKQEGDQ